MKPFDQWFEKNLTIGAFPIIVNADIDFTDIDVCINMSDEFYSDIEHEIHNFGVKTYWFPMNEQKKDIGLNSIFGAMHILWEAEKKNKNVYLSCHAGKNRSQATADAYYFMRVGKHRETIQNSGYINKLVAMCSRGYLPPKAEMEKFLTLLWKSIMDIGDCKAKEFGYNGSGELDNIKISSINNF